MARFRKVLLWSFILFLSITALIAVVSLLGNEFGDLQFKILATTFAISAASICAMSCAAFMEKCRPRVFGLLGIIFAALAAGLSIILIWSGLDSGNYLKITGVAIVLSVAFAHGLLLQIPSLAAQYRWTQKAALLVVMALALEIIYPICAPDDCGDALWRTIGVTSIFVVLMTFVIPICAKLGGPARGSSMRLSHINVTMPKDGEDTARAFYGGLLGLKEIPKPESIRGRGGVWFDAGGLDIHISAEENRTGPDSYRHFGLECADVDGLRAKLKAADVATEDGRPAPWKRFFIRDPFGNRIEIHEPGSFRG